MGQEPIVIRNKRLIATSAATTHTILRKERTKVLMPGKQQHKQTTHICFLFHQRATSSSVSTVSLVRVYFPLLEIGERYLFFPFGHLAFGERDAPCRFCFVIYVSISP